MTGRPQNNFLEVKAMKNKKKRVKFCPKCGSTDIQWASGLPQLWSVWECRDCGYRGAFIVEDGRLAEKIREKFLKRVKEEKKPYT